jgi:uncharacterized protein YggE
MRRLLAFLALLACGVALLAPASAVAVDRTVSVHATVEREVPNDSAEIGFSVTKERHGRSAALHNPVHKRGAGASACTEPSPPVKPGNSTVTATVNAVFALQ